MSTTAFEWNQQSDYVLTELVLFLLNATVIIATVGCSSVVIFTQLKEGKSFFTTLRPVLEVILSSAIGFVPARGYPGQNKIDVVFMGYQENIQTDCESSGTAESESKGFSGRKQKCMRIWIRVYFIILCGLISMWATSVFSYSLLYTKTSSCTDVSLTDTDLTCFQLSHSDVPDDVQQIINEEEGELVPCGLVYDYLTSNNLTYDLEVICYHYNPNIPAAVGIAYGSLKSISFAISIMLNGILIVAEKLKGKWKKKGEGCVCCRTRSKVILLQLLLILCSVFVAVVLCVVVGILHSFPHTKNTSFDYLKGETFDLYSSVFFFIPFTTIYTFGLFPWWAFKPLEQPPVWDTTNLSKEEMSMKLSQIIHYVVLHERFSTDYIYQSDSQILETHGKSNKVEGSTVVVESITEAEETV